MQARGPLMIEHRLIEKMIAALVRVADRVEAEHAVDPYVIDTAVDFVRSYADRTHHGKEEEIMFRDLALKSMSDGDRRVMDELIDEHRVGRNLTREIVQANDRYRQGDGSALEALIAGIRGLAAFYPGHIQKEDRVFFPAALAYVTEDQDQAMLAAFFEFDRKMIHEKYRAVVRSMAMG